MSFSERHLYGDDDVNYSDPSPHLYGLASTKEYTLFENLCYTRIKAAKKKDLARMVIYM